MANQVQPADVQILKCATGMPAPDDTSTTIGGAPTGTQIADVSGDILVELTVNKTASKTRYTKVTIKNNHGSLTMTEPTVYLDNVEPTDIAFELGKENAANQTTTQGTAPAGVTFTAQDGTTAGRVSLGATLAASASVGVWIKVILGQNATTATGHVLKPKVEWV